MMTAKSDDSATEYTTVAETLNRSKRTPSTINSKVAFDDYPIYNPVDDINFESGKSFHTSCHPIDSSKKNIGIAGGIKSGKSTLINALRGLNPEEKQAAGHQSCMRMEPFNFLEEQFQNIVLWEIPYPQKINNIADMYDRTMEFDKIYERNKLHLFELIIVLTPQGNLTDDDIAFSRILHSRRTPLLFLKSKTDDDLDAEARETDQDIVGHIFSKGLHQKAQVLGDVELLYVSSPVVQDILCGSTASLLYRVDEDKLIAVVGLYPCCHKALQNLAKDQLTLPCNFNYETHTLPTVLADAGFEISYGTDDRVYGTFETRCSVRRAGKTAFNYGFAGSQGVGKSALINGIRAISSKHPLAAGRTKIKPGFCQRHEFDDDVLAYSVTLWELHYPKKIILRLTTKTTFRKTLANFTAVFIVINGSPTEQDLTFAKIAFRRNATIVFLNSKCDRILMARSRSEEIPVGDVLKQQVVDKGKFERIMSTKAPELKGRVHLFFVSARVFRALRTGSTDAQVFLLHERAVFDFLKQKKIIAEMLDEPSPDYKERLYACINDDSPTTPNGN
ncbi:unnamed protein product [Enterobius vermicularis]|uniref:IRG-type G domain-containing protein n=1 Tax=Enterobius vermicularis TaxID=51028 RepID=A0A0N4UV36_ENTVE|nr:unnamed protein product [Enterobius vermicularis]